MVAGGAISYRPADASRDLDIVAAIEAKSYPDDEAASRESIAKRMAEAPEFFMVMEREGCGIVGFINGTTSSASNLTHESMSKHEPDGTLLCIHSVVVDQAHRGQGLARAMLAFYCQKFLPTGRGLKETRLICKAHLRGFYGALFEMVGPSPVVHGADPWFEMKRNLA